MPAIESQRRRSAVEVGALVIAFFLPLCFDPFAEPPFEPTKVAVFCGVTMMMIVVTLSSHFLDLPKRFLSKGLSWLDMLHNIQADNPLALLSLMWAGWYLVATGTSVNPGLSLWGTRDNPHGTLVVLCTVVFFLLVSDALRTQRQIERMITTSLLGSIPVVFYGLGQAFGLDPLPWRSDSVSHVLSTLGRSNFLGAYLALLIPFSVGRLADTVEQARRLRYAMVIALQVVCLWLTLARAAWLGFLGGVEMSLMILAWRRRDRWVAIAAVVTLLGGILLFAAMNNAPVRLIDDYAGASSSTGEESFTELREASISARLVIWNTTLGLARERWVTGYGPETFASVFARRYPIALGRFEGLNKVVDDPHNLFLRQLMGTGIIGVAILLSVFAGFYLLVFRALHRCRDKKTEGILAAVLGSVTAFIVQAQFNPNVIVLSTFFWLSLALGVGVARWT